MGYSVGEVGDVDLVGLFDLEVSVVAHVDSNNNYVGFNYLED